MPAPAPPSTPIPTPIPAPAEALQQLLTQSGPPLAWLSGADGSARLAWCSDAFAALFQPQAAAGAGLHELLGASAAEALLGAGCTTLPGRGTLHCSAADALGRRVLSVQPPLPAPAQTGAQTAAQTAARVDAHADVEASRQHELLAHAERLRATLDDALELGQIARWRHDLVSDRVYFDRRGCTIVGLPFSDEGVPLTLGRNRVHPDDLPQLLESAERTLATGQPTDMQLRYPRPDGGWRHVLMRRALQRGPGGEPLAYVGVLMDVTGRFEQEQQLRGTLERLQLTASGLGLGMWESARDQSSAHWDEQMFRLRGLAPEVRVVTRDEAAAQLHPEDRARMRSEQRERLGDGKPWHNEFRVVHPDGRERWLTSKSVPVLDEQGRELRRIGVNWDSTDTRLAGEALRERERAVAESQAKSQAMSRISHELRTPLNAVLGFTQLLRSPRHDVDPQRREDWLARIEDAARHLLALIDDVLELSRAQVGELRVARQAVALAPLVAAALPLVAGQAEVAGVELAAAEPGSGGWGLVWADPVRLRQVLLNLLSNAIKYNRRGGRVTVRGRSRTGECSLCVEDTGVGIAPERLAHAFEPFNRLGAESSGIEGSGIGLALVKVLVEQMAGSVQARSRVGEGSEFEVWLPAASGAPEPAPALAGAVAPGGAEAAPVFASAPARPPSRVLYIEDNAVNALLVREILSDCPGVALEVATDGRSGIAAAARTLPELVLVDMQLPDIDGIGVMAALRADARTAGLRCVVLSANASAAEVAAARAAGCIDYWTKPIDFVRFLADLARLLGRAL